MLSSQIKIKCCGVISTDELFKVLTAKVAICLNKDMFSVQVVSDFVKFLRGVQGLGIKDKQKGYIWQQQ